MAAAIGIIFGLVTLEAGATIYLTAASGKFISAHERFEDASHPWFHGTINRPESTYYCRHIDTLFPHPYLGWVYHGNPPCGYPDSINNIGLHRHNFPPPRDPDHYVVLFTGGSVAEYVGGGNQQYVGGGLHPPYLERALNAKWLGPNGKPFLVLQGGAGGWKQPQQTILFMLYANMVDAVVTLDGGNEFVQARFPQGERFEYPFLHFQEVNPLATDEFSTVVARWMLSNLVTKLRTTAPFDYSSLAFIVAERLDKLSQPDTNSKSHARTSVKSIFAAPSNWSQQQSWDAAAQEYQKYLREMHSVASEFNVKEAYFIQPNATVGKPLTPGEAKRTGAGVSDYGEKYIEWTSDMLSLRKRGIPVYSLLYVYKDHHEALYSDGVHTLWSDRLQESPGYTILAEAMAEDLAKAWHLPRKTGGAQH